MKIGIFDADHLAPSIVRRYGCYADKFIHFFAPLQASLEQTISFTRYDIVAMQYPKSLHDNDFYIITGSQHSSYENLSWINELEKTIQKLHQYKIKTLGICFGHQLIAQCLGGKVEKSSTGWELGIAATHITQHLEWMQPARDFIFTLVSHQDEVTRLPENAVNFAKTNQCIYSGYTIDQHILTLQSHPEFSNEYVRLIIRLQSKNLSPEQHKKAIASLKQSSDTALVLSWVSNFIN